MLSLFYILVFPGFLFLITMGLAMQFIDRKLHARLQNRMGPPWFQPLADLIKLMAKETIIPEAAEKTFFKLMPVLALTCAIAPMFYIPSWRMSAVYSFEYDVIIVFYLLTIPTLTFFLAGWHSNSLYSLVGAVRSLTQLFAYEVPLFLSVLAPALLANTWSLSGMAAFYSAHPPYLLLNGIAFVVALIALMGKLEKVPFDIPEAETEIIAGAFTEYSGIFLAMFRTTVDIEMVVGASLMAAVFMPFGLELPLALGVPVYLGKILFIVVLVSILRTLFARLRIEQMVNFCWKVLAPLAMLQLLINLIVGGILPL